MKGTDRIIFNTVVLYAKILICMLINLWTVPLVLSALGAEDFGLYNLVAGVVAMLAFLNGAMTISTQRYLSVTIGEGDGQKLLKVFNISILLHIIIAAVVVALVELSAPLLFDGVLMIDPSRVAVARHLLSYLAVSMFFGIMAVPFDAVLNAYENMLVFSIVGVLESVLKFSVALSLLYIVADKLDFYGLAIASIMALAFVIKALYVKLRYRHLYLSVCACRDGRLFREMLGFAGWNTVSSLSIIFRNQGLAVVLNHFFGTVVNAAYGIGNQINGVLGYFSSTIQKSINPQLMQSQGAHDKEKLLEMTFSLTKFSTLCMGVVALPLLVDMPYILWLWLGNVPEGTVSISRLIILLSLVYQMSSGLMSAIQSTGRIKWYTITIGLLIMSTVPVAYAVLRYGGATQAALATACAIECVALCVRLFFAKKLVGLSIKSYLCEVVMPNALLIFVVGALLHGVTMTLSASIFRLALVCILDVTVYCTAVYRLLLSPSERGYVGRLIMKILHR